MRASDSSVAFVCWAASMTNAAYSKYFVRRRWQCRVNDAFPAALDSAFVNYLSVESVVIVMEMGSQMTAIAAYADLASSN